MSVEENSLLAHYDAEKDWERARRGVILQEIKKKRGRIG
jgi:hypothetical protein